MLSKTWIKRFRADKSGVALIEFSLLAPTLIAISAGIYEYSSFVRQGRQITDTANSISEILATGADNTINYSELHYAFDSAMLTFPKVLSDSNKKGIGWGTDITISLAGISFSPTVSGCTSGCTYVANLNWTGAAKQRACGSHPTSTANTSPASPTTLPASLFTPVASPQGGNDPPLYIIVADITYTWTPSVFTSLFPPTVMSRSAYISPRYVNSMRYIVSPGDDGFGKACNGY